MEMRLFNLIILILASALAGCNHGIGREKTAEIRTLSPYRVAYVEYKGDFENNPEIYDVQLDKLLKWAIPAKLWDFPEKTKLIVIYPDDSQTTPKGEQRMLMAISVPEGVVVPSKFMEMTIPGGEYAVGRFVISAEEFGASWGYMFGEFIPSSGFYPSGGMGLEIKLNDSDTHPEKKHIVDICIPVIKR